MVGGGFIESPLFSLQSVKALICFIDVTVQVCLGYFNS